MLYRHGRPRHAGEALPYSGRARQQLLGPPGAPRLGGDAAKRQPHSPAAPLPPRIATATEAGANLCDSRSRTLRVQRPPERVVGAERALREMQLPRPRRNEPCKTSASLVEGVG